MKSAGALLLACALAALAPLLRTHETRSPEGFPGWPAAFEGRTLRERPLAARDRRFAESFPGRIATFTDGSRSVLLRWIARPSRELHAAADCLRGAGYAIAPLPLVVDAQGQVWSATGATLDGERFRVRERIVDAHGEAFSDVSSWYWAALLGRSAGPWLAWTVFERE